jgi:hypothetical protein
MFVVESWLMLQVSCGLYISLMNSEVRFYELTNLTLYILMACFGGD